MTVGSKKFEAVFLREQRESPARLSGILFSRSIGSLSNHWKSRERRKCWCFLDRLGELRKAEGGRRQARRQRKWRSGKTENWLGFQGGDCDTVAQNSRVGHIVDVWEDSFSLCECLIAKTILISGFNCFQLILTAFDWFYCWREVTKSTVVSDAWRLQIDFFGTLRWKCALSWFINYVFASRRVYCETFQTSNWILMSIDSTQTKSNNKVCERFQQNNLNTSEWSTFSDFDSSYRHEKFFISSSLITQRSLKLLWKQWITIDCLLSFFTLAKFLSSRLLHSQFTRLLIAESTFNPSGMTWTASPVFIVTNSSGMFWVNIFWQRNCVILMTPVEDSINIHSVWNLQL